MAVRGWNVQSWDYIVYDKTGILADKSIYDGRLSEKTVKSRALKEFEGRDVKVAAVKSGSNSNSAYYNMKRNVESDIAKMQSESNNSRGTGSTSEGGTK